MNATTLQIVILALVGVLGIMAHAFKATNDKNQLQEAEYTFGMYFKKNRYVMYFVAICIVVFAYYEKEWTAFEKLGNWRGLIMFGMGYMGDSVFPSLLGITGTLSDKIKNGLGSKKDTDAGN